MHLLLIPLLSSMLFLTPPKVYIWFYCLSPFPLLLPLFSLPLLLSLLFLSLLLPSSPLLCKNFFCWFHALLDFAFPYTSLLSLSFLYISLLQLPTLPASAPLLSSALLPFFSYRFLFFFPFLPVPS